MALTGQRAKPFRQSVRLSANCGTSRWSPRTSYYCITGGTVQSAFIGMGNEVVGIHRFTHSLASIKVPIRSIHWENYTQSPTKCLLIIQITVWRRSSLHRDPNQSSFWLFWTHFFLGGTKSSGRTWSRHLMLYSCSPLICRPSSVVYGGCFFFRLKKLNLPLFTRLVKHLVVRSCVTDMAA